MVKVPYNLQHPETQEILYYEGQQVTAFEADSYGWHLQDGWVTTTCGWSVDEQTYNFGVRVNGVDLRTGRRAYS